MSRKSKTLTLALAFEVTGKENVDSHRRPSTGTVSIFFLVMEMTDLATRLSLVSCQKGAWRRAFFSEKLNFSQLEKTLRAAEKDAGGGVLKSAQDFFENTVYSIGL